MDKTASLNYAEIWPAVLTKLEDLRPGEVWNVCDWLQVEGLQAEGPESKRMQLVFRHPDGHTETEVWALPY